MTHSKTPRWMKSVQAEALKSQVSMPWARGTQRSDMIARRSAAANAPRLAVKRAS